jgi:hemoglobin
MVRRARIRMVLVAAVLACGVSACATRPAAPVPAPVDDSVYRDLGGQVGIEGIVDDLLDVVVEDRRINFQFALANIVRLRAMLITQFCSVSGGPCRYDGLSMEEAHAGRGITTAQFNALVEDLILVMERRRVPVAAQNRLLRQLAPMHGDVTGP